VYDDAPAARCHRLTITPNTYGPEPWQGRPVCRPWRKPWCRDYQYLVSPREGRPGTTTHREESGDRPPTVSDEKGEILPLQSGSPLRQTRSHPSTGVECSLFSPQMKFFGSFLMLFLCRLRSIMWIRSGALDLNRRFRISYAD